MSTDTLELVNLDELLNDECQCWAGEHGAEIRVILVCCGKDANGCEYHYQLWRNAWERIAQQVGSINCKECEATFRSVADAIDTHPI